MLQQMRQNTKVILWIVILAFVGLIFAVWGMDLKRSGGSSRTGAVGKVNGRQVSADAYNQAYQQEVEAYQGQTDLPVMPGVVKALEERAWERVVNQKIIEENVARRGIVISDDEVVLNIRTNPPDFVRQSETFQKDGQFDYQKYVQYVNDPSIDWRWLEKYFREQLPMAHLQTRVCSNARITEGELRDLYAQRSEMVDFSYIAFLPSEFEYVPVSVTDEEVRAYYDGHTDEFTAEEEAEMEFTAVPIEVAEKDKETIRDRMNQVLQKIEEGTSFEDLARFFSQGMTASDGGNLGVFRKGSLTPDIEETAFSLKAGEVSDIIERDTDMQILKCYERTEDDQGVSIRLGQIYLRIEPGPETIEAVRARTEKLKTTAEVSGLAAAAAEEGLDLLGTGPFPRGTYVPAVGELAPANVFAFSAEPGDVSDPILKDNRYYIFSLVRRDSVHTRTFEEVADLARKGAEREKRLVLAKNGAERFRTEVEKGASLETIAKKVKREVMPANGVSRLSAVPGLGQDLDLVLAAFAAPDSTVIGPVNTSMGSFFLYRTGVTPFNEQQYAAERGSLIRSLLYTREDFFFRNWLKTQREKADIEDYRPELAAASKKSNPN